MPRILIVEDKPDWIEILRTTLNVPDFFIDVSNNTDQAIGLFQKNQYDAVVADLRLTSADPNPFTEFGTIIASLTSLGLKQGIRVPVIVVTDTDPERQDIIRALNNYPGWIWGWQDKSKFDPDVFRRNIRDAIARSKQSQDLAPSPSAKQLPTAFSVVLTVLGTFGMVTAAAFLLGGSNLGVLLQPTLITLSVATLILGLMMVMMANPDRITTIMPFLSPLLARYKDKNKPDDNP